MAKNLLILAFFVICAAGSISGTATTKSYEGYKVIRALATTRSQLNVLGQIHKYAEGLEVDIWSGPRLNGFTDIMVDEKNAKGLEELLGKYKITFGILNNDVQSVISSQEKERIKFMSEKEVQADFDWKQYYPLATIENWLTTLDAVSDDTKVELLNIGTSTEGRNMTLVKISRGQAGDDKKPSVFITSTIHAREWISAATATFVINQLVSNSSAHPDILDTVNFYILPFINPDGYAYSHTSDRMWRKTRSDYKSPLRCRGADANRNFEFKWDDGDVSGSSGNKCDEDYRGPEPFSEPEAAAIKNFIQGNKQINWAVYITMHSYGQYFMCPWGYTKGLPSNYQEMKTLSDKAVAALAALYGTKYTTGSSANVLYYTDGTDQDWALGSGNFQYSYTMELRDKGSYGFLLPPAQIIPTGEETFEAFKVIARNFA